MGISYSIRLHIEFSDNSGETITIKPSFADILHQKFTVEQLKDAILRQYPVTMKNFDKVSMQIYDTESKTSIQHNAFPQSN